MLNNFRQEVAEVWIWEHLSVEISMVGTQCELWLRFRNTLPTTIWIYGWRWIFTINQQEMLYSWIMSWFRIMERSVWRNQWLVRATFWVWLMRCIHTVQQLHGSIVIQIIQISGLILQIQVPDLHSILMGILISKIYNLEQKLPSWMVLNQWRIFWRLQWIRSVNLKFLSVHQLRVPVMMLIWRQNIILRIVK